MDLPFECFEGLFQQELQENAMANAVIVLLNRFCRDNANYPK